MKTYNQNGTISESEYVFADNDFFAIQQYINNGRSRFFYPGDKLIQELDLKLICLSNKFATTYFRNLKLYYEELPIFPLGLIQGGQNSDMLIDKKQFLGLVGQFSKNYDSLYRHLYIADCQYLVSTVQNLLLSAEHCYIQYYMQITQIDCQYPNFDGTFLISSEDTIKLLFYLETFFTKLYSVLDLMVKIIYELESPVESFVELTKLRSADKLWGDRKRLKMNGCRGTIFEDCATIKTIESLRNEAVHNGSWEINPKVYLKRENRRTVERYMLFPDFLNGRLSSEKNRRHFFSTETKVNDMLVLIHDEFYQKLLHTLQAIELKYK